MTERYSETDPEGKDHEIHRFDHFAVGWVEEVAVRPGTKCAEVQSALRESLESYPVLSNDHLSELESGVESDNWHDICKELKCQVAKHCASRYEGWDDDDEDRLDDLTDDQVFEIAHELGESTGDGWIKYSTNAVEKMAPKFMEAIG